MGDDLKNLREVFRELAHLTIDWEFEKGYYDNTLKRFRSGDTLSFSIDVNVVPNDILWANKLDGHPLTEKLYRKILDLKKEHSC